MKPQSKAVKVGLYAQSLRILVSNTVNLEMTRGTHYL